MEGVHFLGASAVTRHSQASFLGPSPASAPTAAHQPQHQAPSTVRVGRLDIDCTCKGSLLQWPASMPRSLTARMSQLAPWHPCRLPDWSGRTIQRFYRICHVPDYAISQDQLATGEWTPRQIIKTLHRATLTTPGVEPGLSRPRRDVLTTRRCGRLSLQCLTAALSNVTVSRQDMGRLFWIQGQCPRWQTLEFM